MNYSDKTEKKKIYQNTYWGQFSLKDRTQEELNELEEVVLNRNRFVKEFKIKSIVNKCPVKFDKYLNKFKNSNKTDHMEIYLTNDDKYIILNSPYDPDEKKVPDMQKIYKMYNNAYSFIKIISKNELN